VCVAAGARAKPLLDIMPAVEATATGDSVVLRWSGVPAAAVEQEVLISLDAGRHWVEIVRLPSIEEREREVPLPRGLAGSVLFAIRVGDGTRELGQGATAALRPASGAAARNRDRTAVHLSSPSDPFTAPSRSGRELPLVSESDPELELERLARRAWQASRRSPWVPDRGVAARLSLSEVE
jgi:hypothetical protein